jgi:hypothetical protein
MCLYAYSFNYLISGSMVSILQQRKLHIPSNGNSVLSLEALTRRKHRFTLDISGISLLIHNRSGCQNCPKSNAFFYNFLPDSKCHPISSNSTYNPTTRSTHSPNISVDFDDVKGDESILEQADAPLTFV